MSKNMGQEYNMTKSVPSPFSFRKRNSALNWQSIADNEFLSSGFRVTQKVEEGNKDTRNITIIKKEESQEEIKYLENYLGVHNNFKIEYKSKRYKKIYNYLCKYAPLQKSYMPMYLEDKLFALNKVIKISLFHRETSFMEYLEPFFRSGDRLIAQFYSYFLMDDSLCKMTQKINGNISNESNANQFLYIVLTFLYQVAVFFRSKGIRTEAERYYRKGFKLIKVILKSSTSNCRIRRKISQILISFSAFLIENHKLSEVKKVLNFAAINTINLVGILECKVKSTEGRKSQNIGSQQASIEKCIRRCTGKLSEALGFLVAIFLNQAVCYELLKKNHLAFLALNEVKFVEKKLQQKYGIKGKVSEIIKKFKESFDFYSQKAHIVKSYFDIERIKKDTTYRNFDANAIAFEFYTDICKVQEAKIKAFKKQNFHEIAELIEEKKLNVEKEQQKSMKEEEVNEDLFIKTSSQRPTWKTFHSEKFKSQSSNKQKTRDLTNQKPPNRQKNSTNHPQNSLKALLYGSFGNRAAEHSQQNSVGFASKEIRKEDLYQNQKVGITKQFKKQDSSGLLLKKKMRRGTNQQMVVIRSSKTNNFSNNRLHGDCLSLQKSSRHRTISKKRVTSESRPRTNKQTLEKVSKIQLEFLKDDYIEKNHIYRLKCRSQNINKNSLFLSNKNPGVFVNEDSEFDQSRLVANDHEAKVRQIIKFKPEKDRGEGGRLVGKRQKNSNNLMDNLIGATNSHSTATVGSETGIRLLKRIIFKHKKTLKISKPDIFVNHPLVEKGSQEDLKFVDKEYLTVQYKMSEEEMRVRIKQNMQQLIQDNIRDSEENEKRFDKINQAISEYEKNKHTKEFNLQMKRAYGCGRSVNGSIFAHQSHSCHSQSHDGNESAIGKKQLKGWNKWLQNCNPVARVNSVHENFILTKNQDTNSQLFLSSIRCDKNLKKQISSEKENWKESSGQSKNPQGQGLSLMSRVKEKSDIFGEIKLNNQQSQNSCLEEDDEDELNS